MLFKLIRFAALVTLLPIASSKDKSTKTSLETAITDKKAVGEGSPAGTNSPCTEVPPMQWWWQQALSIPVEPPDAAAFTTNTIDIEISREFISNKVIGKKAIADKIADQFLEARGRSKETQEHIDIVLKLMPELRLHPYSETIINNDQPHIDFSAVQSGGAYFDLNDKTLYLCIDKLSPNIIVHEMDHAFRTLAHYILSGHQKLISLTYPFFPETVEENSRYLAIHKESDKQFHILKTALFKIISRQRLSPEEDDLIKKLKKLGIDKIFNDPLSFLMKKHSMQITDKNIAEHKIQIGSIVNLDDYFVRLDPPQFPMGAFEALSITPASGSPEAIKLLILRLTDPLIAFSRFKEFSKTGSELHCKQMPVCRPLIDEVAIIREHLSSGAIEIMYPGLIQHDQALRQRVYNKAFEKPTEDSSLICSFDDNCRDKRLHEDFKKSAAPRTIDQFAYDITQNIIIAKRSNDPSYKQKLGTAIYLSNAFIGVGKFHEAAVLLASLAHYQVDDAIIHARLGQAFFRSSNYTGATTHFTIADQKSSGKTGDLDSYMHGISFWRSDNKEQAKKTLKKACKKLKEAPDSPEELQKKCESDLKKLSQSIKPKK